VLAVNHTYHYVVFDGTNTKSQALLTMADDDKSDKSSISSLVGSVSERILDHGTTVLNHQKTATVQAILARDAAAKTVLSGGYEGTPVVLSPHIERMLEAYHVAAKGRVIVMCSPADSGKTRAAEFLVHGDYPFRPERSLVISAAGMDDFAKDFAAQLGVSNARSKLGEFILGALSRKQKLPSSAADIAAKAASSAEWVMCSLDTKYPFEEQNKIALRSHRKITGKAFHSMPALVIDNFNEDTDENKVFVKKLFNEASQYGVVVFILTSNETWATTLVDLNGGSKIKPLYGNVDNNDYLINEPFKGTPRWNSLQWPVAALRELIKPFCEKENIDPKKAVPDDAKMLPVTALDTVLTLASDAERQRQDQSSVSS
jgi:hypothetical protein